MKPSPALLRIRPDAPQGNTLSSNTTGRIAELAAHQARLERALTETKTERSEGRIIRAAEEALAEVDRSATSIPEPGPAGSLRVRVVALISVRNDAALRGPLAGVTVRVLRGQEQIAESRTDVLGLADVTMPDESRLDAEIQVLGVDGTVLVSDSLAAGDKRAVRMYELANSKALAGAFEGARAWANERRAASSRLDDLRKKVAEALAGQQRELEALIAETEAGLATCRRAEPGKAGQEDKPDQTTDPGGESAPSSATATKRPRSRAKKGH